MFATKSSAAKLSLIAITGLVVLKVAVAILTGSISIFAQALDSGLDLFAVTITLLAVGIATRPADEQHPFGHGKVEDIAAVVQAVLIFTAGSVIVYSAINRLITGEILELTEAGIIVMAISIIVSVFLSRYLMKLSMATGSTALEANAHNIAADVYSASGVLAGLVAIRLTGLHSLDAIIAIVVAALVFKVGYDVLRKSFHGLIDVKLPEAEENEIKNCIMERGSKLVGFHNLRTRKAGSQRYIDLHLVVPKDHSVEEAHETCNLLEKDFKSRLHNASVTIHVEPCDSDCENCSLNCTEYKEED